MSEYESKVGSRGGCLDAFVQVISLGYFGVETVTKTSELTPTDPRYPNRAGTPTWEALRTGKTVIVESFKPQVKRRIIRNKKTIYKIK